jgi:hypothetical protein
VRPGLARRLTTAVLLGPAPVRNAAARRERATPVERWMLSRPRAVRESYVREVLRAPPGAPHPEQIWMLRQDDATRESYIQEVLLAREGGQPA